jgi:FkbM family methyltransferase
MLYTGYVMSPRRATLKRAIRRSINSITHLYQWRKISSNTFGTVAIVILAGFVKPLRKKTIHIYLTTGVSIDTKASRPAINPVFEIFNDIYRLDSCPIWNLYNIRTVIDLGAHVGSFSVRIALENQPWSIVALEPDPDAFELLQRNLGKGSISQLAIRCICAAVGPTTTVGWYSSSGSADWGGHIVAEPTLSQANNRSVQILSLADVMEPEEEFASVLMKMDIEGAEYETLYQSQPTDLSKVAILLIEYHPSDIAGHNFESLNNFLERAGFVLVWRDKGITQGNACYARPLPHVTPTNGNQASGPLSALLADSRPDTNHGPDPKQEH